jgi:RHS repeat-associated protein
MNAKLSHILATLLLFSTFPAWSVNHPGGSCSGGGGPCGSGSDGSGTGSPDGQGTPDSSSLSWGIKVGLARYPKPTVFSDFGQAAFELNGNLPSFSEIYDRYFSSSPLQQRQIHLELSQTQISAATFHPSVLFLQSEANFTTLKKPAEGGFPEYIHQILTDDAFTHIEILPAPASGWRLRVWKRDAAALTLSGGYYSITGFNAVTPLTDVTFSRPTGSSSNNTLIYVQKETTGVSGTRTTTAEITQTLDSNGKPATVTNKIYAGEGTTGSLLSQENLIYSERGTKAWDYTITRETLTSSVSASGAIGSLTLTAKTREDYDDFSTNSVGGSQGMKRLVSRTEAYAVTGQTPQTTTYTYIQAPTNPAVHGRMESSVNPDGSWTFMEYAINPTSPVAITTTYSGWKDLTMAQRANARKTVLQVSANEALTEEFIGGTLVSKSKTTLGVIDGDPVTTSERWDGSAWHTTTTAYFPDTAAAPSTGRIKWIENSDGTATTYSYATVSGSLVVTERSGAGSRTGITAGTEVKTTRNLGNFAISEITKDIASNLNIQQWDTDVTYNNGFDKLGRPIKRIYNADVNDYDISQYACCGLEFSRDRMGATTQYYRDGMKRVYKVETKASAASPVVATFTTVDGLTTTQTRTYGASATQFLGTSTRSLDGMTYTSTSPALKSTDSADRVTTTQTTTHNAGTGDTTVTSNNFDASTQTTTAYLSGQMKSSTRTGYATTTYDYAPLSETTTSGTLVSSQTMDLLGRTLTSTSPGSGTTTYTYHPLSAAAGSRGKTATVTDADDVTISYGYNTQGEQTTISRPIPLPGGSTATQVTTTENDVVSSITLHGTALGVSLRSTQTISSTGFAPITTSTSYRSINGLLSGSVSFDRQSLTISTRTNDTTGVATQTTIAPDGTKTITTTTHGLTTLSQQLANNNTVITSVAYGYNSLQQLETTTDSRTGTTTYSDFTEAGQARTSTSPATPVAEITTTTLDRLGRPTAVKLPDDTITYTSYHLSGQPAGKWGSLTNPTFTLYDDQGRMEELRTFQTLSGEPTETSTGYAKTTWNYSPTTGLLLNKKDHEEKGASYTYTDAGRLQTRTWARSTVSEPKVTTYSYTHGMMTATDYSDTTPDVTVEYDAIGRQKTLSNGVAATVFDYDPAKLHIDKETITYNIPGQSSFTRVIDRSQDTIQRTTGYQLKNGTTPEQTVTYRYNATNGRLGAVSAQIIGSTDTHDFIYGYENNSNLLKTTQSFTNYNFSTNTGTGIHQVSNTFEANRDVLLTKANTRASDDSTISSIGYTVNNIGQRTNATRSGAATNSTAWGYDALGQLITANDSNNDNDRAYQYDKIGNREKSSNSLTLPSRNNYTANALNQYTAIGSLNPVYDDDGNATSYPVPTDSSANSTLLWDSENRKIAATVDGITTTYYYDAQSRRIAHTTGSDTTLYLYDTWNVIAEYTASGTLTKTLTWGMDLSQSMQGAGGVGGLLAVTETPTSGAPATYYPLYDGNGNITEYINQSATVVAHYEYDPFGNTIVATEAKANDFNYRFSTKPLDSATGFYYYGYRYYDPVTGRWPSRDPIEEKGGMNLYGFVRNFPIYAIDKDGRVIWVPALIVLIWLASEENAQAPGVGDEHIHTPGPIGGAARVILLVCTPIDESAALAALGVRTLGCCKSVAAKCCCKLVEIVERKTLQLGQKQVAAIEHMFGKGLQKHNLADLLNEFNGDGVAAFRAMAAAARAKIKSQCSGDGLKGLTNVRVEIDIKGTTYVVKGWINKLGDFIPDTAWKP